MVSQQPSGVLRLRRSTALWPIIWLLSYGAVVAGEPSLAEEVSIVTPLAKVAGTLLVPHAHGRLPCVVILGGTMSHDRDGAMAMPGVPRRDALKRLAEALAAGGYASIRYDKVGYGASRPGDGWQGTYTDEARVAAEVVRFVQGHKVASRVIVAGESAGAYLACLAAKEGVQADAYLFLGAFCGEAGELYEYNFGRLAEYAASLPERLAWAEKRLPRELALGRHWREMMAAAGDGKETFELVDGDFRAELGLVRRREELQMRPDEMFRHIQAPALAVAGANDLNVPPEHAARAAAIMREAGNSEATSSLLPNADHSFQETPTNEDLRIRERYTFESFRRPYPPRVYREILAWLHEHVPTSAEADEPEVVAVGDKPVVRAENATEIDDKTETTPRRVQLAPGVEIVEDITDAEETAGVETLEGRIGPLLLAEGCQAHFIDMPAGMYVEEHPHSTESIIYTVRGRWVLCSRGRRHLMKPGTLFRFGKNVPTGYETPFDENAYILIFKGDRTTKVEGEFIEYLQGLAERLKKEQAEGVPFLLKDLPEDHAARAFARKVNSRFEDNCDK